MASKRQFKPERLREIYCHSVSRYSADNGLNLHAIDYTDDDNVTGYKCVLGVDKDGKPSYIKEFFSVMWGNDEVNVFVDLADNLEGFSLPWTARATTSISRPYAARRSNALWTNSVNNKRSKTALLRAEAPRSGVRKKVKNYGRRSSAVRICFDSTSFIQRYSFSLSPAVWTDKRP